MHRAACEQGHDLQWLRQCLDQELRAEAAGPMLYILLFEDDPAGIELRRQHMQAHLDFLDRYRDRILVAGSLRDGPDGTPSGGLWIVDVADAAAAHALYAEDPFWIEGLRRKVNVKHWSKAFPDRPPRV
jgi:uncharacterized protein YciI